MVLLVTTITAPVVSDLSILHVHGHLLRSPTALSVTAKGELLMIDMLNRT